MVALAGLTLIGRQFESLVRSARDMHDEALFLQEFDEFTALPGSDDASGEEPTDSTFEVLSLRGVSFTYPSAPRPAVTGRPGGGPSAAPATPPGRDW